MSKAQKYSKKNSIQNIYTYILKILLKILRDESINNSQLYEYYTKNTIDSIIIKNLLRQ